MAGIVNDLLIRGQHLANPFLVRLDLLGTFVFALSGAAAGVKNKLDLFGLIVLAFCNGESGRVTRDLLIGAVPPAAKGRNVKRVPSESERSEHNSVKFLERRFGSN